MNQKREVETRTAQLEVCGWREGEEPVVVVAVVEEGGRKGRVREKRVRREVGRRIVRATADGDCGRGGRDKRWRCSGSRELEPR